MGKFLDLAYLLAASATSPIWLSSMVRTGKIHTDWHARFGEGVDLPESTRPRILIHAVSVGEVNAMRLLVKALAEDPSNPEVVIAATTDTGIRRAMELFSESHHVVRYPFDISVSVSGFLSRIRPDAVALMELEVWPNFLEQCAQRDIPVVVVNGRLSARSHRKYQKILPVARRIFSKIHTFAVQDDVYAQRFADMGIDADRVRITGNMKWDTAEIANHVPKSKELAAELGIDPSRPLVVAGSTCPHEHALIHRAVGSHAQLLVAPRKPEWFDHAVACLPGCVRRTDGHSGSSSGRFVLDTIGELRQAYALADVVVIGRTFSDLGGSDMIEPIALGKPVIVGPDCSNFADATSRLLKAGGMVQCADSNLAEVINSLLHEPSTRESLVANGQDCIRNQQGATLENAKILCDVLSSHVNDQSGVGTNE